MIALSFALTIVAVESLREFKARKRAARLREAFARGRAIGTRNARAKRILRRQLVSLRDSRHPMAAEHAARIESVLIG